MGDHFVLLVDRLLTESTLEAAIESRNNNNISKQLNPNPCATSTVDVTIDCSFENVDNLSADYVLSPRKIVECRICQDEDEDSNMETPCSCCGSLKYAHRKCVQRWCNEKGDTKCEICHQQFKPGYTAPPPMFEFGSVPLNFRGNWQISRREMNSPRFAAIVASNTTNFYDPEYDEFAASTSRSFMCCRLVAIIFMVLLILRHTLPVMLSGAEDYPFPLILLLILRASGVVLPVYVMVRAVNAIQTRRHQMVSPNGSLTSSDEEVGLPSITQHHARIIRVR